jgi:TolB-like protein
MSDVFISYAHSTVRQARNVADALRALGYSVWLDEDLPAHRTFRQEIEAQLASAKAALVIWSSDAANSDWVLSEASRARREHKLVQLRVEQVRLPMPFDQFECANLVGWSGDLAEPGWRKVLAAVNDLVGVAAHSATPALAPLEAHEVHRSEPLLAVLAFDNLSSDTEMAFFSDGVAEEIRDTVARGSHLRVIGRASSFQFRGADKAAAHVAAELGATHILDGAVRRSGGKVRISADLVDCASATTLWSERFDRDLSDIFAVQEEIATAVAGALKTTFAPFAGPGSIDPAVYQTYLRARALQRVSMDLMSSVQAIGLLEGVVAEAPDFARAWGALALGRARCYRYHNRSRIPGLTRALVVEAADTAPSARSRTGAGARRSRHARAICPLRQARSLK